MIVFSVKKICRGITYCHQYDDNGTYHSALMKLMESQTSRSASQSSEPIFLTRQITYILEYGRMNSRVALHVARLKSSPIMEGDVKAEAKAGHYYGICDAMPCYAM